MANLLSVFLLEKWQCGLIGATGLKGLPTDQKAVTAQGYCCAKKCSVIMDTLPRDKPDDRKRVNATQLTVNPQ